MNRCAAVQRKGSCQPCRANAMKSHTLCGRHAKMKHPILWADANVVRTLPVVKIQACVRRWLIRRRLSYAGIGVLSRTNLANDEDIITYNEKTQVHPMDYVSFEENGKTWWFEFGSLWSWCSRSIEPSNPYTKVPLTSETRKRLRTIWGYKRRNQETLPAESQVFQERLRNRLNILSQHFSDYGFSSVPTESFMKFTKGEYITLFILLRRDIETVLPETDPFRKRIDALCMTRSNVLSAVNNDQYVLQCINLLLHIVTLYRDPYVLTFSILSAFYRA